MPSIYFDTSSVSAVIGMNPFSNGGNYMARAWKRCDRKSYENALKRFESDLESRNMDSPKSLHARNQFLISDGKLVDTRVPTNQIGNLVSSVLNFNASSAEVSVDELETLAATVKAEDLQECINSIVTLHKNKKTNPSVVKNRISNIFKLRGTLLESSVLDKIDKELENKSSFINVLVSGVSFAGGIIGCALFPELGIPIACAGVSLAATGVAVYNCVKRPTPSSSKNTNAIKRDNEIKYLTLGPVKKEGPFVKIGGRFDGVVRETGEIVEVKNRQRKIYGSVFDHERVQVMIYMAMSPGPNSNKFCSLVEAFGDKRLKHTIRFDQEFYNMICSRLLCVGRLINDAISGDVLSQNKIFLLAKIDES